MYYKYVRNPDKIFSVVVKNIFDNKNIFGEEQSKYQINYLIEWAKINKDSIFIDIGSHEGQEISELTKTNCEVHAFEPNPYIFKTLKQKFSNNKNYKLNNLAASTKDKIDHLYFFSKGNEIEGDSGSLLPRNNFIMTKDKVKRILLKFFYKFYYDQIKVKSIDIAKYIKNLNSNIHILKIDTEGTEYEILNHLFDTGVYKKIDKIFYEDHIRRINDKDWLKFRNECLNKYHKDNYKLYEF